MNAVTQSQATEFRGLRGKVAIVTGAAGGIGSATVSRLVENGCRVVAVDIDQHAVRKLAAVHTPDRVRGMVADVSTEEGCKHYVEAAVEAFASIDLFVNNAGVIGKHFLIAELPVPIGNPSGRIDGEGRREWGAG